MSIIENLLAHVDKDKSDRIINSALKEFSINTFEKASTNTIVEDAGVSKGILFHYFSSKEKLFKYLEYFSIKVTSDAIVDELNWEQKDIFIRIKEISLIKFKVFQKYPYLAEFSLKINQNKTFDEIMSAYPDFQIDLYSQIYTYNIDYTLFKEGVNKKKSMDIVRWTTEKYGEEFRTKIKHGNIVFDYKVIEQELFEYIDMLKACFYK